MSFLRMFAWTLGAMAVTVFAMSLLVMLALGAIMTFGPLVGDIIAFVLLALVITYCEYRETQWRGK